MVSSHSAEQYVVFTQQLVRAAFLHTMHFALGVRVIFGFAGMSIASENFRLRHIVGDNLHHFLLAVGLIAGNQTELM